MYSWNISFFLFYANFLFPSIFVFKLKFWICSLKEWEVVNLFPCLQITLHQMSIWYQILVQLSVEAVFCGESWEDTNKLQISSISEE